jgi:hypothetical protein
MTSHNLSEMKAAHRVLVEFSYEARELSQGYANRWLRVDLDSNSVEIRPIDDEMKKLWTGGKGFDLWLTFQEISGETRWDSNENPICFSSGPLGGTMSYPGSGKTLVTAVSPMTNSMIDCNVGGYFGPYLKFAGFDVLMVTGKASEEVIVCIDAESRKVTIETAPMEGVDAHIVAEELTEMYADDELDRKNIAVVAAGRGAGHTLMGVLNFSFYDWRRRVPRIKQAGRGGVGTVLRDKKVKALVLKSRGIHPGWRVAESKVALRPAGSVCDACGEDVSSARDAAMSRNGDKGLVLDMLQDVQDDNGCVSRAAMEELTLRTGLSLGAIYELVTFYEAFSLEASDAVLPSVRDEMAAFVLEQMFPDSDDEVYHPSDVNSYLAPGAWPLVAHLLEGEAGGVTREAVMKVLGVGPRASEQDSVDHHCGVEAVAAAARRNAHRSCGKCTPCREGTYALANRLEGLARGKGVGSDLDFIQDLTDTMAATSLCGFGRSAARSVQTALHDCKDDFAAHLKDEEVK